MRMAYTALEMTLTEASMELAIGRSTLHQMLKSDAGFGKVSSLTVRRLKNALEAKGIEISKDGWVRDKRDNP
jgi:hypothetical protein